MVLNLENISGNGYKKFQIITTLFPQIKVLFPQKKNKKNTKLRHKYTDCGRNVSKS